MGAARGLRPQQVLVVTLLLVFGAQPTQPAAGTTVPATPRLAFASAAGIETINVDGSGREQVTAGNDAYPHWSPDGAHLSYQRDRGGTIGSLIAAQVSGGEQALYHCRVAAHDWAPDAQRVVFQVVDNPDGPLEIAGLDGRGGLFQHGTERGRDPDWAPTGDLIAYHLDTPAGADLYTFRPGPEDITRLAGLSDDPSYAWAPDSSHLAVAGLAVDDAASTTRVHLLEVATGQTALLVDLGEPVSALAWSPTGAHLAAVTRGASGGALWVIAAATGQAHPVPGAAPIGRDSPSWSPDGRWLAFTESGPSVVVARYDGWGYQRLVDPGMHPEWDPTAAMPQPDGLYDGDPTTTERVDRPEPTGAALAVSQARFADAAGVQAASTTPGSRTASYAVLAREDLFADALAGGALTGDGPLLYSGAEEVGAAEMAELDRVLGQGGLVYLLGGTDALGPQVQEQLEDAGFAVRRLAGPTRVETALAVADEVRLLRPANDLVALARADAPDANPTAAWADSVTAGGWAAASGTPILLTPSAELHPAVGEWLAADAPRETVLLGGGAALSSAVSDAVTAPRRVAGSDRAGTAAAVATELWLTADTGARRFLTLDAYRPDGWAFGLAAAGLAADTLAPILVVDDARVPAQTAALVSSCGQPEVDLVLLGGPGIISDTVRDQLDDLDPTGPCPP